MKNRFFLVFSFLVSAIFFSCASGKGIGIPGESERLNKNICLEYYTIAEGYAALKNYTKAAEYYKKSMSDKGLRLTAYYKLGRAYALAKNWDDALDVFSHLMKRDPENMNLAVSIAYITAMKGDITNALIQYSQLVKKYSNDQTILENYISLLISDGKGEIAEKQLEKLKEKFPDSKQISVYAGKIALIVDNPDKSLMEKSELPDEELPPDLSSKE